MATIEPLSKTHILQFIELCRELEAEGAGVSFVRIKTPAEAEEILADPRNIFYGSFVQNNLVGVFRARQGEPGKEHSCYIAAALTASCRRQGFGRKLLDYAIQDLFRRGIWMIRAWVYSNNHPSICSLLGAGFTWAGTVSKHQWDEKEQDYIDDLLFHKDLRSSTTQKAGQD